MSLASPSGRGDHNNCRSSSWYHGSIPVSPDNFANMNMQYNSELNGITLNLQYDWDRPRKALKSHLVDSSPTQAATMSIMQTPMPRECVSGTPKINYHCSLISSVSPQEAGSDGLPQSTQTQEFHSSGRDQMTDDLIQSPSSYNDGSFKGQQPIHEGLSCSVGHSCDGSLSNQCSGGSPMSSQTSQTYPSDSQHFRSAMDVTGPDGNGHSDNEPPMNLNYYMLQELETVLLGPDSDDLDNIEDVYVHPKLLEALSDMDAIFNKRPQLICPKKEAEFPRVENHQKIVGQRNQNVAMERGNAVELKTEFHYYPQSTRETQRQVEKMEILLGDVKQLLIECANAIAHSDLVTANKLIADLGHAVSIYGNPIQRLGAYMVEGLVARLKSSGGVICKALKCREPASPKLLSYMQILYEVCPYFKFGYMAANGAIAEAFKDKDRVHIIDFQIAQGSQWVTLIQALAARPGGSPSVRITGLDDPVSEYARGGGLQLVGQRLSDLAESCKVPFEFHAVPAFGPKVHVDMFEIRPGEALAVNFALQLHHMPDESVNTSNHRDRILRMVKGLAPDVVTLVEQEANTNTAPFLPRFMETLSYYSAVFESLDVTLPRESKDRVNVEQHCLARDIVNIIACEGEERVERHELFGKWRSRLTMAGFKSYPLSSHVNSTIKYLLESYCENYRLIEKDEALYLGWLNRRLIVASAWH